MRIIEKPWGKEELLEINPNYMLKKLHMNKGCRCSLQHHEKKRETLFILSGSLKVYLKGTIKIMSPGDFLTILPFEQHRMEGLEDTIYLEASTPEIDDVVRVEDDYNRK